MQFELKFGSDSKDKIKNWVVYILVTAFLFVLIGPNINRFLKSEYGKPFATFICQSVWKVDSENGRWILNDVCESIKDLHLSQDELGTLINEINMIFNKKENFISMGAQFDPEYRALRVRDVVSYGINEYISKLKPKKYIDSDKPKGFFEDVYEPNKYNEEQITLLEQAKYSEYPRDNSKAQEILGPKRELKYIGLRFPYGLELQKTID